MLFYKIDFSSYIVDCKLPTPAHTNAAIMFSTI